MHEHGTRVSMFVDPEEDQIDASAGVGADSVELHTGAYANATGVDSAEELARVQRCSAHVLSTGLALHAGHGLTHENLLPIAEIPGMHEVNIGHDIIARALLLGLGRRGKRDPRGTGVGDMKRGNERDTGLECGGLAAAERDTNRFVAWSPSSRNA